MLTPQSDIADRSAGPAPPTAGVLLHRMALAAIATPKRIIAAVALFVVACGIFGLPVINLLSAGGFTDPASESARAARILTDTFGQSDTQLLVTVTADGGMHSPQAVRTANDILTVLRNSPDAAGVVSTWSAPPAAVPTLTSTDGRTGVIMAGLRGGDTEYARIARELVDRFPPPRSGVVVRAGGALTYSEVDEQSERDLMAMEMIALPVSFVALVWVFGGVAAAALPMMIGIFAIVGSLAALRVVTAFTNVSVFAINLTVAMGLALAVDYSLLIVSRYRDEIADGVAPNRALVQTMGTAGRTVVFSAVTVALCMSALVLFPSFYLQSFAYAGVAVVVLAAAAAIVITPTAIALLGHRLDALDVRRLVRRATGRPAAPPVRPVESSFWYRTAQFVMRHATAVSLTLVAVLMVLGAPFLGVKWGFPDDRVLPTTASSRQAGDLLRDEFTLNPLGSVTVVIPEMPAAADAELESYAARLSQVADVAAVSAPSGTFVAGKHAGPPMAPAGQADGAAFLTVQTRAALFTDASGSQLTALHAVPGPANQPVLFAGIAQNNVDSVASIASRLPLVLSLIVAITFVVLFLVTGSVVLPLKALALNMLSLTATFGALVWVFQDGHLGGLGTTANGTLIAVVPMLMFCIAFGLSMDYEVFLLSRIREFWLQSGRSSRDSDDGVARGVARTGRVVTAAALLMTISFAALLVSQVSMVKMLGLGLAIAVLVDATVVRMLLLPALMRLLSRLNWWAPKWLNRLRLRVGLSEGATLS